MEKNILEKLIYQIYLLKKFKGKKIIANQFNNENLKEFKIL